MDLGGVPAGVAGAELDISLLLSKNKSQFSVLCFVYFALLPPLQSISKDVFEQFELSRFAVLKINGLL